MMRGVRIAEGDVLVLSIRTSPDASLCRGRLIILSIGLANELLLGRYSMPAPKYPDCLLSRHEAGLLDECREILKRAGGNHRHESVARLMLPRCLPLVQAIGHRMAYEAALDAGVHRPLLDLYEAGVILHDPSWYTEHAGVPRWAQFEKEDQAITAALPHLEEYLASTGAESYAVSPILTEESWENFINDVPLYDGNAHYAVVPPIPRVSQPTTPQSQIQAHL